MARPDGRRADELRPVTIVRDYLKYAEGSVLISVGDTRVICSATIEDKVPFFLRGQGVGWITAEYSMLPRSTEVRNIRESARGKIGGRTHEIQRLIGRALRSVVDLKALGERTIWLDCDVIQADGGTRTSAITGAYVAMVDALRKIQEQEKWESLPVQERLAAISCGIVHDELLLDLCYEEDSQAQADVNVVMTDSGKLVEIQGTAEQHPFSRQDLDRIIDLASKGIGELVELQKKALAGELVTSLEKGSS